MKLGRRVTLIPVALTFAGSCADELPLTPAIDAPPPSHAQVPATSPTSSGVVAHYALDGNAIDDSGYHRDGIIAGATATADRFGRAGRALAFDGIDDEVALTNIAGVDFEANGGTLTAWMLVDPTATQPATAVNLSDFSDTRDFLIIGLPDGTSFGRMDTGAHAEIYAPSGPNGSWRFLALTYASGHMTLFIDGVARGSATPDQGILVDFGYLGRNSHAAGSYLKGALDEVTIFGRALSASEVRSMFEQLPMPEGPGDCKKGAWEQLFFKNQGQCMRALRTGSRG